MDAFSSSKLAAKQQKKVSSALRAAISKKRKIAIMNDPIQRQQHALIPDTTISYGCSQAYAIIEAVKAHNNTKQLVEGFKKCPELMMHIFNQVFDSHPSEQRNIKIHC
ncbi:hypothetical protein G6F42_028564 [Rhizopus arrhizus]|nr:hypothetical protein G6F42_028564 [Rhizopus arrhizus]